MHLLICEENISYKTRNLRENSVIAFVIRDGLFVLHYKKKMKTFVSELLQTFLARAHTHTDIKVSMIYRLFMSNSLNLSLVWMFAFVSLKGNRFSQTCTKITLVTSITSCYMFAVSKQGRFFMLNSLLR